MQRGEHPEREREEPTMKTTRDTITTGKCAVCGQVKQGISRTGPKRDDWACFACIDARPEVEQAVRDYDATRQQKGRAR